VATLFEDYERDPAAADARYRGRTLELSGVSGVVSQDRNGRTYVGVHVARVGGRVRPRIMTAEEYGNAMNIAGLSSVPLPGVLVYLDPDDARLFMPGDKVTVRGRCEGLRHDPQNTPDFFVVVRDCTVVMRE
jgi:hypothetical protein